MEQSTRQYQPHVFHVDHTLRITDPCYTKNTWCSGTVPAMAGNWRGDVEFNGEGRVTALTAWHQEYFLAAKHGPWKALDINVGVDSGQAGVFNDSAYPNGDPGEYDDLTTFYGRACALTLDSTRFGIMSEGVVSSSGYGDGSYTAYAVMHGQVAVAVRIVFIGPEDGDDDGDDEDDSEE